MGAVCYVERPGTLVPGRSAYIGGGGKALMRDWLIYRTFWDLTVTGVALGAIYALVALGYTLVYGVLRFINFAHSEIFMVGTFATLITATNFIGLPLLEAGNYPYLSLIHI